MNELRCLLVSDFTIDGLVPFLEGATPEPRVACRVAPFDQVLPVLLDGAHDAWSASPSVAVVWTRPHAIRTFAALLEGHEVGTDEVLAEVDAFAQALRTAAKRAGTVLVPTWTLPPEVRAHGPLALTPGGVAYCLLRMNARLAEAVSSAGNIHLLDAARWLSAIGPTATSPKLWHLGKIAFAPPALRLAAAEMKAAVRAVQGRARKLIVLDLDDTLWGGVVGDVGWQNLELGGHHPAGEAFRDFQRGLAALARRGVVLGIVSKNTESVALEAIDRHPEMVLRRDDFAGWRINWKDKAENLAELVSELRLGLDSVVFLDDSSFERNRVREALPQVLVPEWPEDKLLYGKALAELDCFDAVTLSDEDRRRAQLYVQERERRIEATTSPEEYLASLGLTVAAERLSPANLARAAQLLNKTNQMNLRTRRMPEAAFDAWARENHAFTFRVKDRFADHGLTGIASFRVDGHRAFVEDFVLSCRVMGRGVEQTLLHVLVERARALGLEEVVCELVPTERNAPCRSFFEEKSGFRRDGDRFTFAASAPYPAPAHVTVHSERHA